ncbi:RagB/SusD family nutrient uptake outer membrane protein [Muricauda sp. JGD-17]|uniref:RagB/SusD family nutrient uptake outer membrane protein n=1 Tax=Flagellimonas ochracea TaxID=2696472 RepID=A0A964TBX7_9FLAO|nr:RagB/SusD family nutrient uptake outer membrane protein [Allomuricauda ochracea]NAY91424.1 RagB/SusD family nutrient uptake outer membrane protein [Allomuricauda ochracea]
MKIIDYNKLIIRILSLILLVVPSISCEDFVEIEPPITELVNTNVFLNDNTATSATVAMYGSMMNRFGSFANYNITAFAGQSADELIDFDDSNQFYSNSLIAADNEVSNFWGDAYSYIYQANAVIQGLTESSSLIPSTRDQLLGEAIFFRAFCYFYLVNFFGDVPLITNTDFEINRVAFRTPFQDVYQTILDDLLRAQNLLSEGFEFTEGERIRPNKGAATALLARVHLYVQNWELAEEEANKLIVNSGDYQLVNLDDVFLKNSMETIWQLYPSSSEFTSQNTEEGARFILDESSSPSLVLSEGLINSFEVGDNRQVSWVGNVVLNDETLNFPFKYKAGLGSTTLTEYYTVFRLAEQYLIRAEARAMQGNIPGAQEDINQIRNRAGLPNTNATDQPSILNAIEAERRIEFMVEFGHRWLDLKRNSSADEILSSISEKDWQLTDLLYPIPELELANNPNLVQNPGY